MKLITDKAAILTAIKSINVRGKRLDNDIWIAAVSAMQHHDKHGDVTIVNELVSAMPNGSRVNALREFILAHGKVTFDDETQTFLHAKDGTFDLDGALAKSWTEFKPEPPYTPVDAVKMVAAMVKKVQAERKDGDKVTKAQAKAILALGVELGVNV